MAASGARPWRRPAAVAAAAASTPHRLEESKPPRMLVASATGGCDGIYELLPTELANGLPLWRRLDEARWLFSGASGQWIFGTVREQRLDFRCDSGLAASAGRHGGTMPQAVPEGTWLRFEGGKWVPNIAMTVWPPSYAVPPVLILKGSDCLDGDYQVVSGEFPNGQPLWRRRDTDEAASAWLFSGPSGQWLIGGADERRANFRNDAGWLTSRQCHGGLLPHRLEPASWLRWDLARAEWVPCPSAAAMLDTEPLEALLVANTGICDGWYALVPHRTPNGCPLWRRGDGLCWVFSGLRGQWFVGGAEEERINFRCDTGFIASDPACHAELPEAVPAGAWRRFDGRAWIADAAIEVGDAATDSPGRTALKMPLAAPASPAAAAAAGGGSSSVPGAPVAPQGQFAGGQRLLLRAGPGESALGFECSNAPPDPVLVMDVVPSSWAARAGLAPGDELVMVDGEPVRDMQASAFTAAMRSRPLVLLFLRPPAARFGGPCSVRAAAAVTGDSAVRGTAWAVDVCQQYAYAASPAPMRLGFLEERLKLFAAYRGEFAELLGGAHLTANLEVWEHAAAHPYAYLCPLLHGFLLLVREAFVSELSLVGAESERPLLCTVLCAECEAACLFAALRLQEARVQGQLGSHLLNGTCARFAALVAELVDAGGDDDAGGAAAAGGVGIQGRSEEPSARTERDALRSWWSAISAWASAALAAARGAAAAQPAALAGLSAATGKERRMLGLPRMCLAAPPMLTPLGLPASSSSAKDLEARAAAGDKRGRLDTLVIAAMGKNWSPLPAPAPSKRKDLQHADAVRAAAEQLRSEARGEPEASAFVKFAPRATVLPYIGGAAGDDATGPAGVTAAADGGGGVGRRESLGDGISWSSWGSHELAEIDPGGAEARIQALATLPMSLSLKSSPTAAAEPLQALPSKNARSSVTSSWASLPPWQGVRTSIDLSPSIAFAPDRQEVRFAVDEEPSVDHFRFTTWSSVPKPASSGGQTEPPPLRQHSNPVVSREEPLPEYPRKYGHEADDRGLHALQARIQGGHDHPVGRQETRPEFGHADDDSAAHPWMRGVRAPIAAVQHGGGSERTPGPPVPTQTHQAPARGRAAVAASGGAPSQQQQQQQQQQQEQHQQLQQQLQQQELQHQQLQQQLEQQQQLVQQLLQQQREQPPRQSPTSPRVAFAGTSPRGAEIEREDSSWSGSFRDSIGGLDRLSERSWHDGS
eukprot:TRINITY_DN10484_c0_g1_i1.p1 TRINITY_DN10484_c0_g1~~TRINITY_DN10484_c0_g1_i1.p1  ORF type:complete len:1273 (+),score=275.69 TRINITY_DN10484_c0_g1_i1:174-3821(+)